MTNIRTRYADVTREEKQKLAHAAEKAKTTEGYKEEERIFAAFRRRAREDFRTLTPTAPLSRR
jgi:hypothetical protein